MALETKRKLLVAGGDVRQIYAARALEKMLDWTVVQAGLSPDDLSLAEIPLGSCDALLLPVLSAETPLAVPAPRQETTLPLETLLERMKSGGMVFGGRLSESVRVACQDIGCESVDYLEAETFCLGNAVPTAEGAIQIVLEKTPFTLHGASVLVVGGGRIGMALLPRLQGLGAKVTLCARRIETRAYAEMLGYPAAPLAQLPCLAPQMQVVMNTVPECVLSAEVLRRLPPDSLVIDLASYPGGVDFAAAKKLGRSVVWALSLPAHVRRCHKNLARFYIK